MVSMSLSLTLSTLAATATSSHLSTKMNLSRAKPSQIQNFQTKIKPSTVWAPNIALAL